MVTDVEVLVSTVSPSGELGATNTRRLCRKAVTGFVPSSAQNEVPWPTPLQSKKHSHIIITKNKVIST